MRLNGLAYEAVAATVQRRERFDLYHSALEVFLPEGRFVIEQAPAWGSDAERGVVGGGAVGSQLLRRVRLCRYEVRRWREGAIPDRAEAVESPRRVTSDPAAARRVVELVPRAPSPVWGRDELRTGEMWNSNSLISWLLVSSGIGVDGIRPPGGGRAPGWDAGIAVARRAPARP